MKKRTLSNYIIKKYISFYLVLVVSLTLFYNISSIGLLGKKAIDILIAENIISADYKNTDITQLQSINGWIEILDENNQVIFTKGKVLEPKKSYTQKELLNQSSMQNLIHQHTWRIASIIDLTYKGSSVPNSKYIATYTTFEVNEQTYTGIVKIPAEKITAHFGLQNPKGKIGKLTLIVLFIYPLGCIIIFILCLYLYSHSIKTHVTEPNQKLINALREITSGHYDIRLNLQAEYEYTEIENSFNILAEELFVASKERDRFNKERQQLLSNIAHDLRTPITTIQGYSKALMEGVAKSPEQWKEYLSAIYKKSLHLNNLITKLLEYSRLENDCYNMKFQITEFTEFIRTIIIEYYEKFEEHNINLELEIPEKEIWVQIDATEMQRVIINLLVNCIVHNSNGISVKVVIKDIQHYCTFEIWDNGSPIEQTIKENIFEPFVSGDVSRQTKNGSGLGLSICKKVIQKHGGIIRLVEKETGWKGFIIDIPK